MKVEISGDKHFVDLCEVPPGNTFILNGEVFIRIFNNREWQDVSLKAVSLETGACITFAAAQPVKPIRMKAVEDAV